MVIPSDSVPNELIRWMEVPRHPNVFALGNFARQVTFASQQTRAFNLIWALFTSNRLAAGQRVAVVGAGLGGMTAAVAALAKGCYVDFYEQASQPCPLQRGNDIRFIHPNILRWPEAVSEEAQTDFPFLNWTAANVRGVIKQIDHQWRRHVENNRWLRRFFNYKVNRLYAPSSKSGPQQPWLSANRVVDGSAVGDETSDGMTPGYLEFSYDCIILAVGFGEERSVVGVPFLSYWENDSLHQETGRGRRSILVSGCGDGGLIDALRLRLRNFDHAEFVRDFLGVAKSKTLIDALQSVDKELRHRAASPDISLEFQAGYDKIDVPKDVERYFRTRKRADTTVTLNSPAPGPLSFRASLLNRYATYLAMRYADLHYLSGEIVAERAAAGDYQITLKRQDVDLREDKRFDFVIIRHGPRSVIRQLIPEAALAELEEWWRKDDDLTTKPQWSEDPNQPHQFWAIKNESLPPAAEVIDLALSTFDSAYRELSREADVQSVAVGEHDGKAGFLVTLKPGSTPRQPKLYAGVLVQYINTPEAPPPPAPAPAAQTSAKPSERRLPVGVGIYNYDAQARLKAKAARRGGDAATAEGELPGEPFRPIGTLGCFAVDRSSNKYLISTSYVLVPEGAGKKEDRIFLEGEDPANHEPIAHLSDVKSFSQSLTGEAGDVSFTVDVASARLAPEVRPDYSPMRPLWDIKGVGPANVGEKVAKLGRTSGLTTGLVFAVGVDMRIIMYNSEQAVLQDSILIRDPEGGEFSIVGDGGAAIVRDDGVVVGLLVAGTMGGSGTPGITVACSLEAALDSLGLKLYMGEAVRKAAAGGGEKTPVKAGAKRGSSKRKRAG